MIDEAIRQEVLNYMRKERKEWMRAHGSERTLKEFSVAIESIQLGGVAETIKILKSNRDHNQLRIQCQRLQMDVGFLEEPELLELIKADNSATEAENAAIERWLSILMKENN